MNPVYIPHSVAPLLAATDINTKQGFTLTGFKAGKFSHHPKAKGSRGKLSITQMQMNFCQV